MTSMFDRSVAQTQADEDVVINATITAKATAVDAKCENTVILVKAESCSKLIYFCREIHSLRLLRSQH